MNSQDQIVYTSTCDECGVTFERVSGRNRRYCPECAHSRLFDLNVQLRAKEGPLYDDWVIQQARRWIAEVGRLGLSLE